MQRDANSLDRCLRSGTGPLQTLMRRAERIAEVNRALRTWIDEPWLDDVRLVNIRGDTAVFFVSTAAVLLPLRYLQEPLITFLRQRAGLTCSKIETKVKPIRHTQARV